MKKRFETKTKNLKGLELKKYKSFKSINKNRFKHLLEDAFSKTLSKNYFNYVKPFRIILAKEGKNYLGGIVVERIDRNIYYLDKIAVIKERQRYGIGKKLWGALVSNHSKFVWRANNNNPINDFYREHCDGMQKIEGWIIYWKGLNHDELEKGIGYAISKKKTMED